MSRLHKHGDLDSQRRLRWIAAALALVGLGALVSHVVGWLPMPYFLMFFGVPSVLLLFASAAYASYINGRVFLNCLGVGLVGGFAGTVVYDGVRFILRNIELFDYDGFTAIYLFGSWIVGQDPSTPASAVAGWTYHFWNGLSFGVFYTLTFGRRHWLYGIGYGVVIEACMLGLFPLFLTVTDDFDFIMLSLIGHLFYGLVLGVIAQKHAMNWQDAERGRPALAGEAL